MELLNQVLDQTLTAQLPQMGKNRRVSQDTATGFDELLQGKQQSTDTVKDKTQDDQTVQGKDEQPQTEDTPKPADAPKEDEEVPEDAKSILAAMMAQPQQIDVNVDEAQPETAEVLPELAETAPEQMTLQSEEAVPVLDMAQTEKPVEVQTQSAAPEQTAPQTARQEELGQTEVVSRPEEVTEVQPKRVDNAGTETVGEETVEAAPEETQEEQTQEVPLFEGVPEETTPIKVADPAPVVNQDSPVSIESEEAPGQIAEVMITAAEDGSEVSLIRISPENLGPVQMTLTRDTEGVLHMSLEALNPKTQTLLQKHAGEIQNILANSYHEEARVEVKESEQPFPQQWQNNQEQQQQQQQQQRQNREQPQENAPHDFLQRLRLGLVGEEQAEDG